MKTRTISLMAIGVALLGASAFALINGRVPTTIQTSNVTGTYGQKVTAQARLVTFFGGQGIAGQPLELEILYGTYATPLGTYWTNNQGVATASINLVKYTISGKGTYTLGWTYRGNGVYSAPVPTASLTVR